MENVKKYLTEYIDEKADIKDLGQHEADRLPLVLKAAFRYYVLTIMGESVLMVKPFDKTSLYRMASWMSQIEEVFDMKAVLLLDEATPYMIKKMLKSRIAFIIPGRQISLPFLVLMIRSEKMKHSRTTVKYSPATQMVYLSVLYSEKDRFTIGGIASYLGISSMSAQRGLSELEGLGLLSYRIEGKTGRKKVFERISQKDYYDKGKVYLDNPVREIVYVKQMPEDADYVIGDLSALAEQTMLGEPELRCYAMYSGNRKQLEGLLVEQEQAIEENLVMVQLMKYDVTHLSSNAYIDPISLMLSLSENDERIQMCIDELMEKYDWYIGEHGEW